MKLITIRQMNTHKSAIQPLFFSVFLVAFLSIYAWIPTNAQSRDGDAQDFYNDAVTMFKMKEYKIAKGYLDLAILMDNSFKQAYRLRGECKYFLDDSKGAMQDYNKAIDIDPSFKDAYFYRGGLKYTLQDYRGAIMDLNKVIQLDSRHGMAYFIRGLSKIDLRLFDDGCKDLSLAGQYGIDVYDQIRKYCQ